MVGKRTGSAPVEEYAQVVGDVSKLVEASRTAVTRSVNAVMTATYWLVGRRIVEEEQRGSAKADYGQHLIDRLSKQLTLRFGRGYGRRNLFQMKQLFLTHRTIVQTLSAQFQNQLELRCNSEISSLALLQEVSKSLPLPWSHYVRIMGLQSAEARTFYESEALRGGWTWRQLDRQIQTQFYERTRLSRNRAAMLARAAQAAGEPGPEESIRSPYVLEFLGLKDEYSESDLEDALIHHLETFLLELGDAFTFVGRQRRVRVGDSWFRVDLVFFHRRLRSLFLVDLKLGKFDPADAGQMHLYLNYAREHWTLPDENPPVGLILCSEKNQAVAHYALAGLPNAVVAAEYRTVLPSEASLAEQLAEAQRQHAARQALQNSGTAPPGFTGQTRGSGRSRRPPRPRTPG